MKTRFAFCVNTFQAGVSRVLISVRVRSQRLSHEAYVRHMCSHPWVLTQGVSVCDRLISRLDIYEYLMILIKLFHRYPLGILPIWYLGLVSWASCPGPRVLDLVSWIQFLLLDPDLVVTGFYSYLIEEKYSYLILTVPEYVCTHRTVPVRHLQKYVYDGYSQT